MKRMLIFGRDSFFGKNLAEYYRGKYIIKTVGREDLNKVFADFTPHIIINCVAEIYDNGKMFESNVVYTKKILDYCKTFNIEKLILFGSSSEYGQKDHPMSETDSLVPRTLYEATKGMASLMAEAYSKTYGTKITLIRPFTIVGRHEKAHKFFPTLYKKWKNNESINLADGNHDFVFIDDFITAVDKVLNYDEINNFNVINIGSGSQTSNEEIVASFEAVLNYKYKTNRVDKLRSFDTNVWVCQNRLLREKYGVDFLAGKTKEEYLKDGISKFIKDCENLNLYGT